jgi:hypothetical protein
MVDGFGVTVRRQEAVQLSENEMVAVAFDVIENLQSISFALNGKITSVVRPEVPIHVSASHTMSANSTNAGEAIVDYSLRFVKSGYALFVGGKIGEPQREHHVTLQFFHRASTRPVEVSLMTDSSGLVALGPLQDITEVALARPASRRWSLQSQSNSYPDQLILPAGARASLPAPPELEAIDLVQVSFREVAPDRYGGRTCCRGRGGGGGGAWLGPPS